MSLLIGRKDLESGAPEAGVRWEALGQEANLWVPLQAAFGFRTWVKILALGHVGGSVG